MKPVRKLSGSMISTALGNGEARLTFSQFGEDNIIWHLFKTQQCGKYLDVGCNHPYKHSNTYALHLYLNWTGVNVDPDQRMIDTFNAARPNDVNIRALVSDAISELEVTFFNIPAVNSVDKQFIRRQREIRDRRVMYTEKMIPRTLADICAEHFPDQPPDFLNVDVEGHDLSVLRSGDWDHWRPRIIAVETSGLDLRNCGEHEVFSFMAKQNYTPISHCVITTIFCRNEK